MESAFLSENFLSHSPSGAQSSHERAEGESYVMPLHGAYSLYLASL
jgi:hypothetical protein